MVKAATFSHGVIESTGTTVGPLNSFSLLALDDKNTRFKQGIHIPQPAAFVININD